VTVCTDLLRPGGYARLPKYLQRLSDDMQRRGAADIDAYILARCGDPEITDPLVAGLENTQALAESAARDPRYQAAANRSVPKRIDSHLVIFDCITCDKCIPVCPNDANFTYPLAAQRFQFTDYTVSPDGTIEPRGKAREFVTKQSMQIANYADYCNECGNCDTFCPEYGGPFIEKPTFFGSLEQWRKHADHDGFCVQGDASNPTIISRIKGTEAELSVEKDSTPAHYTFKAAGVELTCDESGTPIGVALAHDQSAPVAIDMHTFHTLRLLLQGVLDPTRINPANASM
jgi:putative selenate reductase